MNRKLIEALFTREGILDQAVLKLEQRLAQDPRDLYNLRTLGEIYRRQGQLDAAAGCYGRLSQLDPDDATAAYFHALLTGTSRPPWPANELLPPAPFVYLRDFLPPDFHEALLPEVIARHDAFTVSLVGEGVYRPNMRRSFTLWEGMDTIRKRFRKRIRALLPTLFSPLEVKGFEARQIEVKVRIYQDEHFFDVHQDAGENSRVISYVYFFHREPRRYTGGELLLFDGDAGHRRDVPNTFTRIVPCTNSIVFFPSRSFHLVTPVGCPSPDVGDSRFVINGHISG